MLGCVSIRLRVEFRIVFVFMNLLFYIVNYYIICVQSSWSYNKNKEKYFSRCQLSSINSVQRLSVTPLFGTSLVVQLSYSAGSVKNITKIQIESVTEDPDLGGLSKPAFGQVGSVSLIRLDPDQFLLESGVRKNNRILAMD